MAIAFDAKTATTTSATSSLTFSHTCSGTNRILFVTSCANTGSTTTGVTYAGVAMTQVGSVTDIGPTHYLWVLVNPASGANNVVITNSGSVTAGSALSFTGAKQTGQPDATSTGTSTTTASFSKSVTTVADNCFTVCTSRTGSGNALTGGTNTTVANQPELTYFGSGGIWYSTTAKTPAGSDTLNVTCTSQFFGGAVMCSIAPAVAASNTNKGFFALKRRR